MDRQKNGFLQFPKGFATKAVHAAQKPDQWQSSPVVLPIVTSTIFKQPEPRFGEAFYYSRCGNPTKNTLEQVLAALEDAKYGLTFSSGLGAINTLMGLFKSGDHVIRIDDLYGGTDCLFREISTNSGIQFTSADCKDPKNIERAIKPNTKLIFIETPTNPLMTIVDLKAVGEISKKHQIIFVVDNTFLTPYLQRPLDFGADITMYSITKYINGHSDIIMGSLITNNEQIFQKLQFLQTYMGAVPSPFDCYQVNRGLKTLTLRMQRHLQSSIAVAEHLEKHPKIEKVLHPGLPSHPQHELAKRQTSGHCGIFSFYVKGGSKACEKLVKSVRMFTLGGSVGGFHSLVQVPASMSHAQVPAEHKKEIGITDSLIRMSVGLEDVDDLIADLEQALGRI